MKWKSPLIEGTLVKRYKRFFADFELDGKIETAHTANTGSLRSVLEQNPGCEKGAGQACLVSRAEDPNRKLKFTLEAVQVSSGAWVGVNTSWPNQLIKEALIEKRLPHWKEFDKVQPEYKISKETRLDFCVENTQASKKHFIEVKNVSLKIDKAACFPDAVTERGQKHLRELIALTQEGHTAEIVFTVQRKDCEYFTSADEIDPEYGRLLREADKAGVRITVFVVKIDKENIVLEKNLLELKLWG